MCAEFADGQKLIVRTVWWGMIKGICEEHVPIFRNWKTKVAVSDKPKNRERCPNVS